MKEAKSYVEKHFKGNYGNVENFMFPTNHTGAKKWLKDFIDKRFDKFGPFQDFVKQGEDFMFHSCLSTSINIGLLNPLEIIEEIIGKKALKNFLPMPKGDVEFTLADTNLLENYINFKPNTSLRSGLNKFYIWYKKFYGV